MRVIPLVFTCLVGLASAPTDARAEPLAPIYLTIAGQGAIRVRLMSGYTAPCDSSENGTVFEGWLEPGSYRVLAPRGNVCLQHTFGELRDGDWSTSIILPTMQRVRPGLRRLKPLEITLSTEQPYA